MESVLGLGKLPFSFLKTLYLFGKSDIPAAALPSVCAGANSHMHRKGHRLTLGADGCSPCACCTMWLLPDSQGVSVESITSSHVSGASRSILLEASALKC
jgi:hypothetical protein